MALNKQVHIYSIDTSAFYNDDEIKIHKRMSKNHLFKNTLKKKKKKTLNEIKKETRKDIREKLNKRLSKIELYIKNCSERLKNQKEKLYLEFKKNDDTKNVRCLNNEYLNNKNIISVFDSSLTRTLEINENTLSLNFMVVQTYFFEVIEDIILDGFMYNNEKYICLTASAGQIRTKKTVFIRENSLIEYQNTLMCGLTIEEINELGGVNINKYLAYLALCNSATDAWGEFNINKTIVVDDMETVVNGLVDFIDDKTYSIERKYMDIQINHTDGCGMILPKISDKSFMVRLPWVKGLLVSFAFDNFIIENKLNGKIIDIYGVEHDVITEGIEIIFTKSQFKMYKYYKSWSDYKERYIKYNCQAGICNEEDDDFNNVKMGYQMIQTLTDMTDLELKDLSKTTIHNIKTVGNDRKTMLRVLGVTLANISKNYYQQALEIYPELLNDTYSKEILKQVKKSIVKDGRSGKLNVNGAYTFICPDLYAFCEYLFMDNNNPDGLLKDGEVFCSLFKQYNKLDCLRSPHLYLEHAIRKNIIDEKKDKWFITNGLYTSCHDIISKILMFDVDGDKSLVCVEKTLISVAERNMKDIVPLYYNMAKAEAMEINNATIFSGLKLAYTGGNIGQVSNNISKIWNSGNVNLDAIKLLCMENNFTIDYAKTLYKPQRPTEIDALIKSYTKLKVPHFFIYAKNKKIENVEKINKSVVNRLEKIIPNPIINFKAVGLNNFDYRLLLSDPDEIIELDNDIVEKYRELDLKKHFMMNLSKNDEKNNNITHQYQMIKEQILEIDSDFRYVVNVLVEYLYMHKKSNYKTTLWECFGDVLVENLKNNIKNKTIYCECCGDIIEQTGNRKKYCDDCWKEKEKEIKRQTWHRNKEKYKN